MTRPLLLTGERASEMDVYVSHFVGIRFNGPRDVTCYFGNLGDKWDALSLFNFDNSPLMVVVVASSITTNKNPFFFLSLAPYVTEH